MSLKKNIAANYFGQSWQALMNLAFVPLYVKYLGIEAYGLIGIFAILQAWLSLLDMGMKPALGREMARFVGGALNVQSIRDLLRSIEIAGSAVAVVVALVTWAASGWLTSHWVIARKLPDDMVAQAFCLMGVVTALRFVESIYVSAIVGLQCQVLYNAIASVAATTRGLGAIGLLAWVSPTVGAFFLWQGLVSMITVALLAATVNKALPPAPRTARFSWPALVGIWRFAAGMVAITFLALLLTQIDKILLSRLISLESFGYYALAGVAANALYMFAGPITTALSPRFAELVAKGDQKTLGELYHQGSELVTVLMGSAAVVLIIFGERVLRLWTGDPTLSQKVAPLMAVLALGALFNGLMWIPYQLQLANGWTSLAIKANIIAVGVLVPAIVLVVPTSGALGAAEVWVTLNAGYILFTIPIMHRRLLRAEHWRWYRQDVAGPLGAAAVTAILCHWAMPSNVGKLEEFGVILTTSACVLLTATLAAPAMRHQVVQQTRARITPYFDKLP